MNISLAGKAAIVTGSGRGIGFAIARKLAEAGCAVMIADVDACRRHRSADRARG